MNTKDLLKEAIADAKAVRETALAQAKLALEEAFTPRLQSMFAAKLQETMDDMEEADEKMEEAKDEEMVKEAEAEMAKEKMEEKADMEEFDDDDNSLEEIDLDEILAELDDMDKDELKEAKEESEEDEIEAEEDVEDMEADKEEGEDEEKEVSELSMDELEELIRDIVSQEMEPGDEDELADAGMTADGETELPDTTDDEVVDIEEVNLDEILAELLDEEDSLDERKKYGGNKGDVPADKRGDKKDTAEEEGVEDYKKKNLDEGLKDFFKDASNWVSDKYDSVVASSYSTEKVKLTKDDVRACREQAMKEVPKQGFLSDKRMSAFQKCIVSKGGAIVTSKTTGIAEAELEEAIATIQTLRQELQEVNLLNAKLLYVNKIFKAKNLTESQKIKVVQAFDKAESAKEAKLVYESLNETFAAKTEKATIKESLGFASKAAGVAEKSQQIVESNEWIARMQKLANIK